MTKQINEVEQRLGETVEKELSEKVSSLETSLTHKELLTRARDFLKDGDLSEALTEVNRALENKETAEAFNIKAMIISRNMKYNQAIDLCTKELEKEDIRASTTASLYWNRACYRSLDKKDIKAIISDLEEAILHNIELVGKITSDEDLEYARQFQEFERFSRNLAG